VSLGVARLEHVGPFGDSSDPTPEVVGEWVVVAVDDEDMDVLLVEPFEAIRELASCVVACDCRVEEVAGEDKE